MLTECQGDPTLNQYVEGLLSFISHHKLPLTEPSIVEKIFYSSPALIGRITQVLLEGRSFPPVVASVRPDPVALSMKTLLSGESSDFKLIYSRKGARAGSTHVFALHTCLLSKWPLFVSILTPDLHEYPLSSPVPPPTFAKIIKYFYLGSYFLRDNSEEKISMFDAHWILHSAEELSLTGQNDLLKRCREVVNTGITRHNWYEALSLGVELDDQELQEKASRAIPDNVSPGEVYTLLKQALVRIKQLETQPDISDKI
jgi:hypothetical protein